MLDSTDLNPLGVAKAIVNMIDPAGSRPAPTHFPLRCSGVVCSRQSGVQQRSTAATMLFRGAGVSTVSHPRSNDLR